jgi:hypothetical protein
MSGWLFDENPAEGSVETFHTDPEGFVIHKQQDITALVERNAALRNSVGDYQSFKGETFHQFASVPKSVIEDMIRQNGMAWWHDKEAVVRWIQDRDQSVFKTHPKNVL